MTKNLTEQELLFNRLVSELITYKNISNEEKQVSLLNFLSQSEFYYDVFCESVYILMTNDSIDTLSIDNTGYSRFDIIVLNDDNFVGFELLTKEDIVSVNDDIIVYIDLALKRLQTRLLKTSWQKGLNSSIS